MERLRTLVMLLGLPLLLSGCRGNAPAGNPGDGAQGVATPDKELGPFVRVPGLTRWLVAGIYDSGRRTSGSFNLSSSYSQSPRARNEVFFDTETETFRRLLPSNDWIILAMTAFPEARRPDDPGRTTCYLYEVVKADTDRDGELDEDDRKTVALSDADGGNYTELIADVEEVHTKTMSGESTLLVIHRSGGKLRLSRVDLQARQVVNTADVPSFGPDVR